ncbi:EAL domain-containing protein [Desulfohalobiaceae bacterium Ax17]|uniref:sensor domain-containing protein n=1 Tax=Desulfovulcanus ferrireducens TaxID=2831190 RepID=UPI00207BA736|nr:bifunctional diguanylate cyclase/phosphodiesterase [Desulfovulcanus ferrireducens]MBT8764456.1 EAL domain-containing protein [Desulfovulcanus ferrireducens]
MGKDFDANFFGVSVFLKSILDISPLPIFVKDKEGYLLLVNRAYARVFGRQPEELIGQNNYDLIEESQIRALVQKNDTLVLRENKEIVEEISIKDSEGNLRYFQTIKKPLRIKDGTFILSIAQDITELKKAHLALEKSEKKLRVILDSVYDAIFIHDAEGKILDVNARMLEMFGVDRKEALKLNIAKDYSAPGTSEEKLKRMWQEVIKGKKMFFEWQAKRPGDEVVFPVEIFLRKINISDQNCILATVRDISERKKSEDQLRLAAKVFESKSEGIVITDAEGTILHVNEAFCQITGYSRDEVIGKNPRIMKSDRHDEEFYKQMWQDILTKGFWQGEVWDRRKDGEIYPKWLSISAVKDDQGNLTHFVAIFSDLTAIKQTEEKLELLAHYDFLTGLPNRLLFNDRLRQTILRARRNQSRFGLIYLDLDGFKLINDSLGHIIGDQMLKVVGQRLKKIIRETDTIARLGGDEFGLIITDIEEPSILASIAQKIKETISEPFRIRGYELFITVSIGITIYPDDGRDEVTLMQNADSAMYQAKSEGKNNYNFFSAKLHKKVQRRLSIQNELQHALKKKQFLLFYQPKVQMKTRKIVGAEALIRWQHPIQGLVPPDEFIPVAEETGLIYEIGQWVINDVCSTLKRWQARGQNDFHVAVNLSAQQFWFGDITREVHEAVKREGISPKFLELELTESMIMRDVKKSVQILNQLKAIGFKIAVDDFGTGYSSLAYLKRFPLDLLKIDRSFIEEFTSSEDAQVIVKTIIFLGHSLGLKVIAEGVETEEQLRMLEEFGCDQVQGYLFSPPIPAEQFEAKFLSM